MEHVPEITNINEYRAQRRRAGSIRWVLVLVLLVVCLFAGYFFARSGFFAVTEVHVSGNGSIDADRLRELSGFKVGVNIFSVTVKDAEQWLKIEPTVATATVRRKFPGKVEITVTTRKAVALINLDTALIEIDSSGRVLSRYRLLEAVSLPLLTGLDLSASPTMPGCTVSGDGVQAALDILSALPENAKDVGEINTANPQDIRLYTSDGTEVRLGDSSAFADKYAVYSNILADNARNDNRLVSYVDVRFPDKPTIYYK